MVALLNGLGDAITLRSSDAVDYMVNTTLAVEHSLVLKNLISDLGECDDPIPLVNIGSADCDLLVEFMNISSVNQVHFVSTWVSVLSII